NRSPFAVWNANVRWLTVHYVAFGPLALALALAHNRIGFVGLVAFVLPPALLSLGNRQYLNRTRANVEELQRALVRSQEAEEALRDSESRFRQLAGAIPEVFFLVA